MNTFNLTFHITGPTWAWWILAGAAAIWAIAYATSIGLDLYRRHLQRKAVARAWDAGRQSAGIMGGSRRP